MEKIKEFIWFFIPRFVIDEVAAIEENSDSFRLICLYKDIRKFDVFTHVLKVKSFTWLGWALTYKIMMICTRDEYSKG